MKMVLNCVCLGALLNGLYFSFWKVTDISLVAFTISVVAISLIVFLYMKQSTFMQIFQLSLGIGVTYIILAWVLITIFPPTIVRDIGDVIYPYQQSLLYGLVTIAVIPLINMVKFKKN